MATLLQNVQAVCLELGLPSPSVVASSTDETTQQLQALMNRVGDTLTTEADWQMLVKEYRFPTVAYTYTGSISAVGATAITGMSSIAGLNSNFQVIGNGILQDTQVVSASGNTVNINIPATGTSTNATYNFGQVYYPMPADYQRIVNKTQYNKSNRWAVIGPKDAQEWQWLKSSYITTGPRMRFRIIGNKFCVWPQPTENVVLGFEYQSNSWVLAADGTTYKTSATADTDTFLFPDRLLVLGTKLKYFEIKGFDTTTLYADFQRELSKFKAQDNGADTLSLAPKYPNVLLTQNNLPDTGYGNTTT